MTRTLIAAMLLALTLRSGPSQVLAKAPAFEVASITPCKPGTPAPPMEHTGVVHFTYPGGRFDARATSVSFLLEWAYGIQPFQHAGGPSWLTSDRYDIEAKAEGNATDDQMKLMVQTLLADRFHLKLHHESRNLPAYVLSVGKTAPKLTPPKDDETHSLQMAPRMGADQKVVAYRVTGTRFTVKELADAFGRQLESVIDDRTGLTGEFDFTVELAPDESRPNPLDVSLLISALRDQLGLTLKSQKEPVDFLVIDGAEKVAAGN